MAGMRSPYIGWAYEPEPIEFKLTEEEHKIIEERMKLVAIELKLMKKQRFIEKQTDHFDEEDFKI